MSAMMASRAACVPDALATVQGLGDRQPSLAAWYGEPLAATDAEHMYAATEHAMRSRLCAGIPVLQLHVLQLLCHFWMDVSTSLEYRQLTACATLQRDRALLELVYGQLLLSRRQRPALQHLDRGFSLGAAYLSTTDYFRLVRRHDLLRHIPLSADPAAPQGLQSLLAEAAVIRQLLDTGPGKYSDSHHDTLG